MAKMISQLLTSLNNFSEYIIHIHFFPAAEGLFVNMTNQIQLPFHSRTSSCST